MKIIDIREQTVPISSPIRNAYIDFSKMTLSLVAVVTDVIRDGKPVTARATAPRSARSSCTPPAALTTRARTTASSRTRCAAISTAATRWGVPSVLQDGQKLAVDANGRFDLDTAVRYAKALSQYDLFWYEEPGDRPDYGLQATLRHYYKNPMATGEDLFSMQDARNLIRYGGMRADRDWLQFDCALVRPGRVLAHARHAARAWLVAAALYAKMRELTA